MTKKLDLFDSEAAIRQAGGDAGLADELFGMLLGELSDYQQKIDMQFNEGDHNSVLETVHKLNGATRYTGVPALSMAASRFEQALRSNSNEDYNELCSNLLDEIQRLKDAYPK